MFRCLDVHAYLIYRQKVGSWGFKVDQLGESHHPWSDRPLNLRLNSFVENFNDEEQGLKVAVAFDK